MSEKPNRFLLVRTDRIGDVLLSVPAAAEIKKKYPDAHITLLCRNLTRIIGERTPSIDSVISTENESGSQKSFFHLAGEIRDGDFNCAIVIHPDLKMAMLLRYAGIPVRVGTGYRAYSFLFNRRRKEHRKVSTKHELEYNLGLLEEIGIEPGEPEFEFTIEESEYREAEATLNNIGIPGKFCILHPGSGGSAMDWPAEFYGEAARKLSVELGMIPLITWGPGEKALAEKVIEFSGGCAKLMPGVMSLPTLAAIIKRADVIVAPSTGVLHLAVTVGTHVIGLYPSVLHMSPVRWGPYGDGHTELTPEMIQPDGVDFNDPNSMRLITPESVISAANLLLTPSSRET